MVAPSTLHLLESEYPTANGYAEVGQSMDNLAGEAVAGAWVLQRLGVPCSIDGRWLADSALSQTLLNRLQEAGIDTSLLHVEPNYHPIEELVIADGKTRTVFGGYRKILFNEKQWNTPSANAIAKSSFCMLDPFLHAESESCARLCVEHGIPYVTCDATPSGFVAQHATANIISEEFLLRENIHNLEEFFAQCTALCPGWVVLTFGSAPLWYAEPGTCIRSPLQWQPFSIHLVDSTGAGDSFRAGFLYALWKGMRGIDVIRTAGAVAALNCERFPGVLLSPKQEELDEFLHRF